MKPSIRWVLPVALGILGGVAYLVQKRARIVEVETAPVRWGAFEEELAEEGRTRARGPVEITAPVTGVWQPMPFEVGDPVPGGAPLGHLSAAPDAPALQAQRAAELRATEAALTAARATERAAASAAAEAARAVERGSRIRDMGGMSPAELERLESGLKARTEEWEAARAQVSAAAFSRDALRALLPGGGERVAVRAPSSGVVLRIDEKHPRVVPAGTPLLMLGEAGTPELVIDVLSDDAPRIRADAPLRAIVGGDTLTGHVRRVEPTARTVRSALGVEEQRVRVIGELDSGGEGIGHDFALSARILLLRIDSAAVIPTGALIRDGARWSVFTVDARNRARQTPVTLVGRGPDEAAVLGVPAGSTVILYPPGTLRDGVQVRP